MESSFKIKHLVEIHDIQIFSSNFALYGDISNRIMNIIRSGNSEMEVILLMKHLSLLILAIQIL